MHEIILKYIEKKEYRQGIKVTTYNYERFAPQAKALNMLPSYIIFKRAQKENAYDALLIDRDGNIIEGTRSNFFAIKNKTLTTPPLSEVLDGVTRRTVIECAKQNGYNIKEENIPLKNIFDYDGAFLTNTSGKIMPVKTIDVKLFSKYTSDLQTISEYVSFIIIAIILYVSMYFLFKTGHNYWGAFFVYLSGGMTFKIIREMFLYFNNTVPEFAHEYFE